jgi:predicted transcriptional regulator
MSYYPLTAEMWLKLCHELKHSERVVFLHVKTLDETPKIADIAKQMNFSRLTVSRSINKLIQLGYLTAEEVVV